MRDFRKHFSAVSALALAAAALSIWGSSPASADRRGFGIGVGIGAGAVILNELSRGAGAVTSPQRRSGSGGSGRSRSNDDDDDSSSSSSSSRSTSRERSTEDRAADYRNYAAKRAELDEIRRTEQLEHERDVQKAIRSFVEQLESWHKTMRQNGQANVRVSTGANINQVTDGEVRRAVEAAYKSARLYEFEKLAGEIWTKDRLTVRILDYSRKGLDEYFKGVGVKGASISDVEQIFEKSARHVYAHALQVAELIGVSHSFDRFIRTIFEQSDRVDESLSTLGADGRYERIVGGIVDSVPRQAFISDDQVLASDPLGLEKQFLFRFRARRVLYDCLSSQYSNFATGGGPAKSVEIAQRNDSGQQNAPSRAVQPGAEVARPAALGQEAAEVWDRLREFLNASCRDPMGVVLTEAKDGRIQPRPARWDSTGGDGAFPGRPQVIPSSNTLR